MKKKKLLIFIDWFVPAYKAGGPISSVRNLCSALEDIYEIYVVTSNKDLGETEPLENIVSNQWIEMSNFKVIYLPFEQQTKENYIKIYKEIKPNIVHLNSLFSKYFTLYPLAILRNAQTKIVVSPRGMLGPESLKIKPLKKLLFFAMTKSTGLFKKVTWHASSSIESLEIQKYFRKKASIFIAPNFSYFPAENKNYLEKKAGEINLISVGRISPIKNIDFLLQALATVTGKINCKIIGPIEDTSFYEQCESLAKKLPASFKIEFIKGVNHEELDKMHCDSHLFISPTKNENFGHSIVEAMGHGCPVIISDKTPWKNLAQKKVGNDLALVLSDFSETIQRYVNMDGEEFTTYRKNSRKLASEIFYAGETLDQYKNLYN